MLSRYMKGGRGEPFCSKLSIKKSYCEHSVSVVSHIPIEQNSKSFKCSCIPTEQQVNLFQGFCGWELETCPAFPFILETQTELD